MIKDMRQSIAELQRRKAIAEGSEKDVARQHGKRHLTARERIDLLFEPDTFSEIDSLVLPRYESYLAGRNRVMGMGW